MNFKTFLSESLKEDEFYAVWWFNNKYKQDTEGYGDIEYQWDGFYSDKKNAIARAKKALATEKPFTFKHFDRPSSNQFEIFQGRVNFIEGAKKYKIKPYLDDIEQKD